jgi:hypothetical protein
LLQLIVSKLPLLQLVWPSQSRLMQPSLENPKNLSGIELYILNFCRSDQVSLICVDGGGPATTILVVVVDQASLGIRLVYVSVMCSA